MTTGAVPAAAVRCAENRPDIAPILIVGASGALGSAYARICETRNLAYRVVNRQEMDIADPASVERALEHYRPWAIINAGGYARVDDAEQDAALCFRSNTHGPTILAVACVRHGIQLMTFSSNLVFDGRRDAPYVESDAVAPLNVYGRSKVEAERRVMDTYPEALVIRTSACFGPWNNANFLTRALNTLRADTPFLAANDITVSPTYLPDLVHASLDLMIDRETGIWHLTNGEPITWADLALKACGMAGISASRLEPRAGTSLAYAAQRPKFSALQSERALLLPTLDDALSRYLKLQQQAAQEDYAGQAALIEAA